MSLPRFGVGHACNHACGEEGVGGNVEGEKLAEHSLL